MNKYMIYNKLQGGGRRLSEKIDALAIVFRQKSLYGSNGTRKKAAMDIRLVDREKDVIQRHWEDIKTHEFWFKWYKKACMIRDGGNNDTDYSGTLWKYIPDDIYFMFFCGNFHDLKACGGIDDKNLYDLYFHDIKQPETLVRKIKGRLLGTDYGVVDYNEAIKIIKKEEKVVLKPAKESSGGKGLLFIDALKSESDLERILKERDGYIVQKAIHQHPVLNNIHKESINTIRITSFYYHGEMHILSSVLRMGVGKSNVDNASSGGLFCGITDDGHLKKFGYDKKMNVTLKHPTTGIVFKDVEIPNFNKCKQLVLKLAYRFIEVSQLTSWDIAIGEDGMPILIECNLRWGDIDFHQIANGPLFGEMTEDVIRDVFSNKYTLKLNKRFY